jgi:DNA-binding transcriptional LysR family regulator
MSLEQLETVVAIAEEGALTRAARRLHISQPPLTRRLRALEDELGALLFERSARGMTPTPAGAAFLPRARAILASVEAARRSVSPPAP